MEKLAGKNAARLIDLLNERLTFERNGVKLYDAVLQRVRASPEPRLQAILGQLEKQRGDEKEHEEWLEEQIRALGGDAHAATEHARLVTSESEGIDKVVLGDPAVPHELHALLVAELADNAGWDLLVQLASEFHDHGAKREFKKRLHAEEKHLLFVRKVVEELTARELSSPVVPTP